MTSGRPPVPVVPPEVLSILAELRHPIRLSILLALEQHERTSVELCDDLGLERERHMDMIQYALKRLRQQGLVTVTGSRKTSAKSAALVYTTQFKGWNETLKALSAVAGIDADR